MPVLSFLLTLPVRTRAEGPFPSTSVDVFFPKKGGFAEAVIAELAKAKETVLVQAYSFTSAPIAQALVAAHKRGILVQVVLDKSQRTEKYSSADFFANGDIPTYIDFKHAIAHNKIIILDGAVVLTGSFNFTKEAEASNAENLLVIHDSKLAERNIVNWRDHQSHAENYAGR